jgi:hypothetical protein
MIRVEIYLDPFGFQEHSKHLHTIRITNDRTGTQTYGNYKYWIGKRERPEQKYRQGNISGFPRKRESAVKLLHCVLADAFDPKAESLENKIC